MTEASDQRGRVRFYGPNDLSAGWYAPRVVQIAEHFDANQPSTNVNDILELHNVQRYLEHGLLPADLGLERQTDLKTRIPKMRRTVAGYFSEIVDENIDVKTSGVSHEFHRDLVDLLGRHKAFERCRADITLYALNAAGVPLRTLLTSKQLVRSYDSEIRDVILTRPANAEYLIQKYLERSNELQLHLPRSLSADDVRRLLDSYLDSDDPNINYTRLIAIAGTNATPGIDAKLKLKAKRRSAELESTLITAGTGLRVGWEIGLFDGQSEADRFEIDDSDGLTYRYRYSREWLEDTIDFPSILNNFVHLFEFVDDHAILELPYYPSRQGVMERLMGVTGRSEYSTSPSAQVVDNATQVQTAFYRTFLAGQQIDLEVVISWFFEEYVVEQYAAEGFSFSPSDPGASYLQRVRHLFPEMESLASQFSMFALDGIVDPELLTMAAEPVRYKELPSLLPGNYAYATGHTDFANVLHLLFSDQSELAYIDESRNDRYAARLLVGRGLTYSDFHAHQKSAIDYLAELEVIKLEDLKINFASPHILDILWRLNTTQAVSYYHLSADARRLLDSMVERAWITRRDSLLTDSEADFFNFKLNSVDFTNGPQLRNRYQHGSQSNAGGEIAHFDVYITALKLAIALVIKINDNFCQAVSEGNRSQEWPGADINFCLRY